MRNRKISIPAPFCFQTSLTVQVSDINYGGHVGNERYLLFAQETRMRFLSTIGCSEQHFGPFGLVLTEAHVEFFHELFHGNTIRISLAIGNPSFAGRYRWCCIWSDGTMGRGSESWADDRHHLQRSEPAGAGPAVPLPRDRLHHHGTSSDPLPAGQEHRPQPSRAGG